MSEDYGNDLVTIADEKGEEYTMEHIATADVGEDVYMAFLPADIPTDHENYGLIILRVVDLDGEMSFVIPEEDEMAIVHMRFIELFEDEFDDMQDGEFDEDEDEDYEDEDDEEDLELGVYEEEDEID